jgi:hypothetical protein
MSNEKGETEKDAGQQLYQFVAAEMKLGNDRAGIIQKLTASGVDATTANDVAGTMYDQIAEKVRKEQMTATAMAPALVGGAAAAVVGGGAWGAIVIFTGYEIGYVAWGMGILAGVCVVWLSGGRRGVPLQLIAVGSSVLGILIGKYLTFYSYLRQAIAQEAGEAEANSISMLSGDVLRFFVENATTVLGPFDALWVLFALGSAWSIPKGSGIRLGPVNPYSTT